MVHATSRAIVHHRHRAALCFALYNIILYVYYRYMHMHMRMHMHMYMYMYVYLYVYVYMYMYLYMYMYMDIYLNFFVHSFLVHTAFYILILWFSVPFFASHRRQPNGI